MGQWRDQEVLPRYIGAGCRRMAYVVPEQLLEDWKGRKEPLGEQAFTDEAQARAWLCEEV
ncbi:MAG: hypothetical protein AAFX99_22230 [Myxococcota bacterium]